MNAKQFSALLVELKACPEAREWASGKSLAVVWKTCKRGDWLLWLCGKMADKPNWPTRKEVVLAACDCAEPSLKHVPAGEERPRKCIETVRAWAAGRCNHRRSANGLKLAAFPTPLYAAYSPTPADSRRLRRYAAVLRRLRRYAATPPPTPLRRRTPYAVLPLTATSPPTPPTRSY